MRHVVAGILIALLPAFTARGACIRLAKGESRVVEFSESESPTLIPARYKLTRTGEESYLAELDLVFDDTLAKDAWHDYAARCLEQFSGQLKSQVPTLRIRIGGGADVPVHHVKIGGETFVRSHSLAYTHDAHCGTVTHEVLHLLGLVDEYPENGRDDGGARETSYACRELGPERSVMYRSDRYNAESTAPKGNYFKYEVEECHCDARADCTELARKASGRCPRNTESRLGTQVVLSENEIVPVVTPAFFVLPGGKHRLLSDPPAAGTVPLAKPNERPGLYPAHLRAISRPGCFSENRCYYASARNAYLPAWSAPLKNTTTLPNGCLPIPDECKGGFFRAWD